MKEDEKSQHGIDRRVFLAGAGVLAAAGLVGAVSGCTSTETDLNLGGDDAQTNNDVNYKTDETADCDVLVVGAGASGLAAAVQAAELGARVICIERQSEAGGNCIGVEGCFGINSQMQKQQGVVAEVGSLIRSELAASQFRATGPGYIDLLRESGNNIDWLVEQGVEFGQVDSDYGNVQVFHRYASGYGKESYVAPMVISAEANGVEFRYQTRAESLVTDGDGAVIGLIATNESGRSVLFNARAVIVATGGFADNEEYMSEMGLSSDKVQVAGVPGHDGDGHRISVEVGARSNRSNTCILGGNAVWGLPGMAQDGKISEVIGFAAPFGIWVNENAERFINEDFAASNIMTMSIPTFPNKTTYVIMDTIATDIFCPDAESKTQLEQGLASGEIIKADTAEDLAAAINLDPQSLNTTLERYNGYCDQGTDEDYGKTADSLIPFRQAPYYAFKITTQVITTIGSLSTDRSFRALDVGHLPIEGLYVIGVEGAMLWCNVYTINISGTCNANNVNSGRTAARHIVENLL
ncbi:MAG: FAD-binding protein [Coriobacteriales bacterium]|jgi:fumarate reductase flavoprotein subunit|nr:FAD-binding protein [Coriobacteriales bacterium]